MDSGYPSVKEQAMRIDAALSWTFTKSINRGRE
jgi:hypothetical protein